MNNVRNIENMQLSKVMNLEKMVGGSLVSSINEAPLFVEMPRELEEQEITSPLMVPFWCGW